MKKSLTKLHIAKTTISNLDDIIGGRINMLTHLTDCKTSSCASVYSCAPQRSCDC